MSDWLRGLASLPPDTVLLYLGVAFALGLQSLAVTLLLLERRRRQAAACQAIAQALPRPR